jgi:hypothetical protein
MLVTGRVVDPSLHGRRWFLPPAFPTSPLCRLLVISSPCGLMAAVGAVVLGRLPVSVVVVLVCHCLLPPFIVSPVPFLAPVVAAPVVVRCSCKCQRSRVAAGAELQAPLVEAEVEVELAWDFAPVTVAHAVGGQR